MKYISPLVMFFLLIASTTESAIVRLYFHDEILSAPSLPPPDSGWSSVYPYPYDVWVGNWPDYNTNFHSLNRTPPNSANPKWLFREWNGGEAEQFHGVARFGHTLTGGDQINLATGNFTLQMGMSQNSWEEDAQLSMRVFIWRSGSEVANLLHAPAGSLEMADHPIICVGIGVTLADETQIVIGGTFGPSTMDGAQYGSCVCNCTSNNYGDSCNPPSSCLQNCTQGNRMINMTIRNDLYVGGNPYMSDWIANGTIWGRWDECQASAIGLANFTAQQGDILVVDVGMRKNQHHPMYQSAAIGYDGTSSTDPLNALSYIEFDGIIQEADMNPDLTVSALTAPTTVCSGATFNVSDTTKNQGTSPAGLSITKYYLSTNSSLDSEDTVLGFRTVPSLTVGESSGPVSMSLTIPSVAPGKYYIIANADDTKVVFETNEKNNKKTKVLYVGPDLIVSSLTVPESAARGASISITDTTKNNGCGLAGESTSEFYLSTNTVLDAADVPLGGRPVPSLSTGAASKGTTNVTIPSGIAAGTWYIIVVSDAGGVVAEGNETNNTKYKAITITP